MANIKSLMQQGKTTEWETPQYLFDELNKEFEFTLDPCCTHENAKCEKHYTREEDGLAQSWAKENVFMNCPYGQEISAWVEKAYDESITVSLNPAYVIVGLLPARTSTAWFHDFIYNYAEIRFIKGRLKFSNSKNSAPFPSMIVIWR